VIRHAHTGDIMTESTDVQFEWHKNSLTDFSCEKAQVLYWVTQRLNDDFEPHRPDAIVTYAFLRSFPWYDRVSSCRFNVREGIFRGRTKRRKRVPNLRWFVKLLPVFPAMLRMNMKKLFFIAVLLGSVIFIGILGFAYWRQLGKTPQEYFVSGKEKYDQGKFSDATLEFLNAIKRDGNHRDSRYYLALSYLSQQDLAAGVKQLRALLEIHPDDVPANLKLGGIYLEGGQVNSDLYQQAQDAAQKVLTADPQNVEALMLAGNASAGLKDYSESVEWLEKAVTLDAGNAAVWISLGSVRAQQKNFPEAEKAFLKAREVDPKGKNTLISLANYYRVAGSPEKAAAVFNDALSQFPADSAVYSPAADFYLGQKRNDEVERIFRAAQAASASDPAPTIALADFFQIMNRAEDSRKLLLDAKLKFPDNIPLSAKLAANLMADKPDQAKKEIDQILKAEPKKPVGHVLLGELQYASGQFDAAAETLGKEPALGSAFPQVHYLLGNLASKKGKVDEAQGHYQQSIKVDKRYIPALVALANVFLVKGKLLDAGATVRQALEFDPRNKSGRLIKAVIDAADKNYSAAESGFSDLAKEFPGDPEVHRQMGLYLISRGRNVEAEKSFTRALDLAPNEQSFRDMTIFYLQTKQIDRARQRLDSVPDAQKQAFHYELIGMTAEQAGKLQDSEMAFKKALEKDPNRLGAASQLFNQYLRTGRLDDALKSLDGLEKKFPSSAMVSALRAEVKAIQGNSRESEANYRKALQIDPNIDVAANNLAFLLAEEGRDLEFALGLAQGARQRQPQSPEIADTLGWVYYKLDRPILARGQAEFAVSVQPQNGGFQYHLGEIYKKNSQNAEAVKAFKKAVSSPTDFKEKSLAEAQLKDMLKVQTAVRP